MNIRSKTRSFSVLTAALSLLMMGSVVTAQRGVLADLGPELVPREPFVVYLADNAALPLLVLDVGFVPDPGDKVQILDTGMYSRIQATGLKVFIRTGRGLITINPRDAGWLNRRNPPADDGLGPPQITGYKRIVDSGVTANRRRGESTINPRTSGALPVPKKQGPGGKVPILDKCDYCRIVPTGIEADTRTDGRGLKTLRPRGHAFGHHPKKGPGGGKAGCSAGANVPGATGICDPATGAFVGQRRKSRANGFTHFMDGDLGGPTDGGIIIVCPKAPKPPFVMRGGPVFDDGVPVGPKDGPGIYDGGPLSGRLGMAHSTLR